MPPFWILMGLVVIAAILTITAPLWSRILAKSLKVFDKQLKDADKALQSKDQEGDKEKSK